jgi:hypothetical protein
VIIFEKIFPILLPLTKLLAPQTTLLSGVITLEGDECFRTDCGDLFLVPLRIPAVGTTSQRSRMPGRPL